MRYLNCQPAAMLFNVSGPDRALVRYTGLKGFEQLLAGRTAGPLTALLA
jgi:hypothetical protein